MNKMSRMLTFVSRTLLVLLVATCLTSHLAARLPARFASSLGGDGSGRVAKFSGGTIYYETLDVNLTGIQSGNIGYYAFVVSFRVEFDEAEVSRKYSLTLKFDNDAAAGSSLIYPSGKTVRVLLNKSPQTASASNLGFSSSTSLSAGKAYYSFGVGEESNELLSVSGGTAGQVQLVSNKTLSMNAETHYYKIVVFENIIEDNNDKITAENEILHLMADIVVEQVD